MDSSAIQSDPLQSLQSSDELGLLDAIDNLRSQGLSHCVELPQLVVCGDQSSGKSSVLEAISGIPFPTKDNLCTRFATELILRRTAASGISVTIVPGLGRSEEDCQRLSQFKETLVTFHQFPDLLDKAKDFMGIETTTTAFSEDVLRIEISGPDRPHLTIVDLPGLIHSENKQQSAMDVDLVRSMVKRYIANQRSIILAVVSAKNDYANQIVTKLSKDVDKKGHRTLGIITKPDTLPVGSESELGYANLAQNQEVEFRLGWHVLRNRDYEARNSSTEERNKAEEEFFSQGIWRDFPKDQVGIVSLRARLSKVLLEQISKELPSLLQEIELMLRETEEKLQKLGTSRATLDEQRLFLVNISQSFQSITKEAHRGTYGDSFFSDVESSEGYSKHLRAVVQNLNIKFAETMRAKGHLRNIVEEDSPSLTAPPSNTSNEETLCHVPEDISRKAFISEIANLIKRTRGQELPGMFNPLIVGDLFRRQSEPWEYLVKNRLKAIMKTTYAFLRLTIAHLTDDITAEALFREIVDPFLEVHSKLMSNKVDELLAPHQKGQPITYNHYFTETIHNMRQKRREAEIGVGLQKLFWTVDISTCRELSTENINKESLISALACRSEADMDRYASSDALDCMQAYYKVTLKSVVDNITSLAVEQILMNKLEAILLPDELMKMPPEKINKIASEPPNNISQREILSRKILVLRAGIETCKQYSSFNHASCRSRSWLDEFLTLEDEPKVSSQDTGSLSSKQEDLSIPTPEPPEALSPSPPRTNIVVEGDPLNSWANWASSNNTKSKKKKKSRFEF